MSSRERQLWTEFVRKREGRKDEKPARKRCSKRPEPTPAELEATLDDLVGSVKERSRNAGKIPIAARAPVRRKDVKRFVIGRQRDA